MSVISVYMKGFPLYLHRGKLVLSVQYKILKLQYNSVCAQQCAILAVTVAGINCGSQWKGGFCFHVKHWLTVEECNQQSLSFKAVFIGSVTVLQMRTCVLQLFGIGVILLFLCVSIQKRLFNLKDESKHMDAYTHPHILL